MNVECSPDYMCQYIPGYIAGSAGPVRIGAVIIKRSWRRVSDTETQPADVQEGISLVDRLYTPSGTNERMLAESDLALVKERADVVVLDDNAAASPGDRFTVTRSSNRQQASSVPVAAGSREILGWSPRQEPSGDTPPTAPRRIWGGSGDLEEFEPFEETLPAGFSNLYFNGMLAAPAGASASDINLDNVDGIASGDLLQVVGDDPSRTEYHVVDAVIGQTGQVLLATPLLHDHAVGTMVHRASANVGSGLEIDTNRTMNAGQNQLAVSDATAATLAAGQVLRVREPANPHKTQFVTVESAGSRTIRGTFRFDFDVDEAELHSVSPSPVAGDAGRRVAYALPFTWLLPGEALTLNVISGGSPSPLTWKLPATSPSASALFRDRSGSLQSISIPVNLDTVVYLRHAGTFTTVWRGRWNVDDPAGSGPIPPENYVALRVA